MDLRDDETTEKKADSCDRKIRAVQLEQMIAVLSKGGKVFRATLTDTSATVAVKSIILEIDRKAQDSQLALLKKNFDDVEQLRHPNLVRHIHHQENPVSAVFDPPSYQIIMEFLEGPTLHSAVKEFPITPQLLQKWTRQIVDAVAYLHEQRCIHRDIKGENILTTTNNISTCDLKLADLGDLKRLLKEATQTKEVTHEKGTWAFMSPEMIIGENTNPHTEAKIRLGRKTDIWSLGCVIIEMINGGLPEFYKTGKDGRTVKLSGDMAVMYFVGNGGAPTVPVGLPGKIQDFIQKCISRNPQERPSADDLKTLEFLSSVNEDVMNWILPQRPVTNS